ncbi:MAG: biotin--[acetyl-CoA-carboxylase] ligase [Sandaracinaceae bacterium]
MSHVAVNRIAPSDLDELPARLTTRRLGRSLVVLDETDSTNDDARRAADAGCPDGHVVVANAQRKGRGSHGRSWSSPPGEDIYASIVLRLDVPPARLPPLTLCAGLAVARALSKRVGIEARLKWPNDVLIEERKCAGLLVETSSVGARASSAIVGIGIGVNRARFDPPLDRTATSVHIASGRRHARAEILAEVLAELEAEVDRFVAEGPAPAIQEIAARLAWIGERVNVGELRGRLIGLDESSGALRIDAGTEVVTVVAGTLERDAP